MSVWGSDEDIPTNVNWSNVFYEAGINGVSAICYEAVKRLPADRQPDFDLLLRWDISARGIREDFHYRHQAMCELRDILKSNGMEMLLLKGETLADNYPQPELRESGDVDFVGLPDFAACNSLIESLGIELETQEKHSGFCFKDVHFENHTLEPTGGYNQVHHKTFALLRESLPNAVRRSDGCLELDPITQAVFVVKHTAQHICYAGGKIALRMLLDLVFLLRRYPFILESWEPALKRVGLDNFAEIMLCAADFLLGTTFRDDWSRRMRRRTKLFCRLFLTESNRPIRYFVKFAFLPLSTSEVLHIIRNKIKGAESFS